MRPLPFLRCARLQLAALLLAPSALAIVDLNFNGLSDSWEKTYNGNTLFPADFELTADPDQDGWTNENEAIAGTDPFDGNPGPGMVSVQISHTAATFADTNSDGILEVITPAACTLVWNSLPAKRYTVEYSPDLGTGTEWLQVTSFTASQTQQTFNIHTSLPDGSEPPGGFWRVKVTDLDENGDGLTNYEAAYYGTNRYSRDTDGDGVSDWDEITKNFSSPLSAADGDSDGIPDDFEKNFSRKLLEGNSDPATWPGVHADLLAGNVDAGHVYTGDGTTAGEIYGLVSAASYDAPETTEFMVESQVRWNSLDGDYTEPYDENPGENSFVYSESAPRGASPFPVSRTINLTQSESNAGYLTGHIGGAAWDRFSTPSIVRLSQVPFEDLVASSRYLEADNLPVSFHCDGSIQHYRTRIIATDPSHQGKSRTFLRVDSWKPWGVSSGEFGNVLSVTPLTVGFTPGQMVSSWIEQTATMRPGEQAFQYLIPVERAPEVLAVNSDFDEGRIDPVTGYAIPDCDDANLALEAERKHLDGIYAAGERITDDLHPGFFGVNPLYGGTDFWTGATVTIGKVSKIDPDTGHLESGHVRLYGKWGNGPSQYRAIVPYDFNTLATTNLAAGGVNGAPGESVYGVNSPFPSGTSYFIEGVHPGKITLEWRYQKGSVDVRFEQSFEIYTRKTALHWRFDLNYKIRLETSNDPSGEIKVEEVPLPVDSYKTRIERVTEFYDFYRECHHEPLRSNPSGYPHALTWAGLARLAGNQAVSGLSDSQYGKNALGFAQDVPILGPAGDYIVAEAAGWSAQEIDNLQLALVRGARSIFRSIGWMHHAYRSSGYRAIEYVRDATADADAGALAATWRNIHQGVLDGSKFIVDSGAVGIANREQNFIIVPAWSVISGLGGGYADDMFSVLGKNPSYPAGLNFIDVFPPMPGSPVPIPTGNLANTADRWKWVEPTTTGGIIDTWTSLSLSNQLTLSGDTCNHDARRFSLFSGLPVYVPILSWDHLDVP